MALFELEQDYGGTPGEEWKAPTFKECAAVDIDQVFFTQDEHAEWHTVDGKQALVILEDQGLKERSAHWEAGAKQNVDTGLYLAYTVLHIRVEDYGPKPKVGKQLVLDKGEKIQRTYNILSCEEEAGVYRISMERTRQ